MADELSSTILKKRLAIWAIGQALPESSALKPHIRAALTSVALAAAAGTLAVIGLLAVLAGVYFYLIDIGMATHVTLGFIGGIIILLSVILYAYARSKVHVVSKVGENTSLFSHNSSEEQDDVSETEDSDDKKEISYQGDNTHEIVGEIVTDLVSSFIDGIFSKISNKQSNNQ